jgi:hypothetical protein
VNKVLEDENSLSIRAIFYSVMVICPSNDCKNLHTFMLGVIPLIVCMVKFVLGPDTEWEAERIADVISYELKKYYGFRNYVFFENPETGEYIGLSFWDNGERDLIPHQKVYSLLREMEGSKYQWEPSIEIFNVYVPRGIRESGK